MAALGPTEIAIIIVVFFLLFGAERLPKLARSLGSSKAEFDAALQETRTARSKANILDLEAGGRTPDQDLIHRAKAVGLDPTGAEPDALRAKVEALDDSMRNEAQRRSRRTFIGDPHRSQARTAPVVDRIACSVIFAR